MMPYEKKPPNNDFYWDEKKKKFKTYDSHCAKGGLKSSELLKVKLQ